MEVKIDGWKCERCGYVWPRIKDFMPRVCARCHNPYWSVPRRKKKKEE